MAEADVLAEIRASWAPPTRLHLDEWADRYAVLSAESSADVGRWRTIPYQRGILRAMTDRHIERVSVMKSARVGYTKMLNHLIGYHAHYDPCPIAVVQPTIGDSEGYSKDEIAPMIRDTPVLQPLFPEPGKRESGNTILHKVFPGGQLRLIGADSPRGFRRVSIRAMLLDEIDGYAPTAGEEGDQLKLAERRTDFFWNRKLVYGSTPTLDQTSRIRRMFERGDQRYYFVPCPHCDAPQVLKWESLRWDKGKPETAHFVCVHNGCVIEYRSQRRMVEEADRRQRAGEEGIGWVATNPDPEPRHASFHIWAAYSYSPNATWEQLAREWLSSYKNIEERKTYTNTVLGLTYKGEGDAPEWKKLYDRRELYPMGTLPNGAIALYAGVDVQKDRLEVELVAYGRGMRSWSIDHRVIPGDTSQLNGPNSPWPQLAEILNETFATEGGGQARVRRVGIDSGYNTNTVYLFVHSQAANRVIAVDGRDSYQMIIGQPKAVEVKISGKRKGKSVKLWPIGSSLIKTELYGWLKQEKPTDESGDDLPYGYCHFPQYPEEYFKQLTAEEIVPRLVKGFRRYQWEKVYDRNEVLDCRGYARASAALDGIDRWTADQWDAAETELGNGAATRAPAVVVPKKPKVNRPDDPYL